MAKRVLRTEGNYDADAVSLDTSLVCADPSRTRQSEKEEADINTIVKNFGVTGVLPVGVRAPSYGDFDTISDYRTAIEAVRSAESAFLAMPAEVRARFEHDAGAFVDFCSDPANLEEMKKLGLVQGGSAGGAPASSEVVTS